MASRAQDPAAATAAPAHFLAEVLAEVLHLARRAEGGCRGQGGEDQRQAHHTGGKTGGRGLGKHRFADLPAVNAIPQCLALRLCPGGLTPGASAEGPWSIG